MGKMSNCLLFRRAKTFSQQTTKIFQLKWMLVTYGTIKMLYHGGFSFWPLQSNIENLKTCLNNMHSSIKFAFENPEIIYQNDKKVQVLNSLDVKKKEILHEDNSVETDIYYKQRNTHDYLPNNIAYSDHTKNNIP